MQSIATVTEASGQIGSTDAGAHVTVSPCPLQSRAGHKLEVHYRLFQNYIFMKVVVGLSQLHWGPSNEVGVLSKFPPDHCVDRNPSSLNLKC